MLDSFLRISNTSTLTTAAATDAAVCSDAIAPPMSDAARRRHVTMPRRLPTTGDVTTPRRNDVDHSRRSAVAASARRLATLKVRDV